MIDPQPECSFLLTAFVAFFLAKVHPLDGQTVDRVLLADADGQDAKGVDVGVHEPEPSGRATLDLELHAGQAGQVTGYMVDHWLDPYRDAVLLRVAGHLGHMGDRTLTIRRYYFPWCGAKHVALTAIRSVQRAPVTVLGGRARIWGTTTGRYWANLDVRRPRKDAAFVLDLGHHVRPFITPDDPDSLEAALRSALPGTPFDVTPRPSYGV